MPDSLAWVDVKGGMNAADPPHSIAENQVCRMVNCRLEQGYPTTRYGTRAVPLSGAITPFQSLNNQGSIFFNPAKGQGGITLSEDMAQLLVAAGGRKFSTVLTGRKDNTTATITDITGGKVTAPTLHLVWWLAAEDLALANDGESACWLWRRSEGAKFSPGYNVTEKAKSSVPNGGTVLAYTHSRIVDVVNGRILAGDNLHRTDSSTSKNLEDFIEQTYWATGQYFLPPTSLGNIMAAMNMATPAESNDGFAGLWFHLEDGLFSLNLNVYPRSEWAATPMIKTALETPGAAGPYAVCTVNGDQLFLNRLGLMSLKWAIGTNTAENPLRSLGEEVACWLRTDYSRWQRFRSLTHWVERRRVLATTSPIVQGRHRWHRGIVVRNELVTPTAASSAPAWEGLWTFPPQYRGVVQVVKGIFSEDERQFFWARGADEKNRLVEVAPWLKEDVLEDGTRVAIPCQVITRQVDAGKWWQEREYTLGRLFFREIRGMVRWGVWIRSSASSRWTLWQSGTAQNDLTADAFGLVESEPLPLFVPLGKVPPLTCAGGAQASWVQCLIRWQGFATLEGIRFTYGQQDLAQDVITRLQYTFAQSAEREYDDFEYYDRAEPAWVTSLKSNE